MSFNPDSPVLSSEQDRYSYQSFARGLAREIAEYDRHSSFTIGICGPWGSGKTSLLNLTVDALKDELASGDHNAYSVILPFSPWIVGNRESLLQDLLPTIANRIREQVPPHKRKGDFQRALAALETYGRAIKGVELGLTVGTATATAFGVALAPWLAPLAAVVSGIGTVFGTTVSGRKPATLDELKRNAQGALEKARIRILLIIDDLDRLDPGEVIEIARLIRSTLDLPHITFLVAYDRDQVSDSISQQLSVNGSAYLEKIIQLEVHVPSANSLDLGRALAQDLETVFGDLTPEQVESVRHALWVGARRMFLKTPRDIGRIVNATSFGWSMLKGGADPGDLLAVSCLKVKAPEALAWCKAYCEDYFLNADRGLTATDNSEKFRESLIKACGLSNLDHDDLVHFLDDVLPGLSVVADQGKAPSLFKDIGQKKRDQNIRQRRLASPEHWRRYFDLGSMAYGLTDAEFTAFLSDAIGNPERARATVIQQSTISEPTGTNSIERLVDRINAEARSGTLSEEARVALVGVLAGAGDSVDENYGPAAFFGTSAFQMLNWTLQYLLEPLPVDVRNKAILDAVGSGQAICWLAYVLRSEYFAHGRIGEGERGERILSPEALDSASEMLVTRLRELAASGNLLQMHSLASPLLFWLESVDSPEEVRKAVDRLIGADLELLKFLEGIKQMVRSTSGDYWRIDRKLLSRFINVDQTVRRLEAMAGSEDSSIRQRASDSLEMIRRDREN